MQHRNIVKRIALWCVVVAALVGTVRGPTVAGAQSETALTGVVSLAEEGVMEVVVVTTRCDDADPTLPRQYHTKDTRNL